jgi:hypothetical protein
VLEIHDDGGSRPDRQPLKQPFEILEVLDLVEMPAAAVVDPHARQPRERGGQGVLIGKAAAVHVGKASKHEDVRRPVQLHERIETEPERIGREPLGTPNLRRLQVGLAHGIAERPKRRQ